MRARFDDGRHVCAWCDGLGQQLEIDGLGEALGDL